jgi:nitrite reductase (NO-forming)
MRIQPALITVSPGVHLRLRVTNEDSQAHDLNLATGQHTERLRHGESETLDVGQITSDIDGWCAVAGHRADGMTMRIAAGVPSQAGDGHGMDASARFSAGFTPYPASLPPPERATLHRTTLRVIEKDLEVAPGVRQRMWTFGGTVPGPVLRGRVGDVFEITLINDGSLGHGIDFHAGALAPERPMRVLNPGESLVYRFQATRAGAWLYHCSNMPLMQHLGNGMYGAVIIDPPSLSTVEREYVLVSGELFLGVPGEAAQVAKMRADTPDAWTFNGVANQYATAPLPARAGERVRVWVVAAGPSSGVSFHVVGAQFDTAYKEGAWLLRPGTDAGAAQALDLAVAQGGFVEFAFPEPGRYPFVDHDLRRAAAGAAGAFVVAG